MGELVRYRVGEDEIVLRDEDIPYLVEGNGKVTPKEAMRFAMLCKTKNLNPWLREVFLIKYSNDKPATIVVGKQYYERAISNSPLISGLRSGVVVERGGEIEYREDGIIPPGATLVGGWAEVYRRDWQHPIRVAVNLSEYTQYTKDANGRYVPNSMWRGKPSTMIVKVAEEQAMRRALPDQLGGIYAPEEMGYDEETFTAGQHPQAAFQRHPQTPDCPPGDSFLSDTLPTAAPPSDEPPVEGEVIEEPEPEIEPPPQDEEKRQRLLKALFAALNDYEKAKRAATGSKKSLRAEVEQEMRTAIEQAYGKLSLKSLDLEEIKELLGWVKSLTADLQQQ